MKDKKEKVINGITKPKGITDKEWKKLSVYSEAYMQGRFDKSMDINKLYIRLKADLEGPDGFSDIDILKELKNIIVR